MPTDRKDPVLTEKQARAVWNLPEHGKECGCLGCKHADKIEELYFSHETLRHRWRKRRRLYARLSRRTQLDKMFPSPSYGTLSREVQNAEKRCIFRALALVNGHRELAANILDVSVSTLYRKLRRYPEIRNSLENGGRDG